MGLLTYIIIKSKIRSELAVYPNSAVII